MDIKKDHINVCIRIRPVLAQDNTASSSLQIIHKEPPVLLVTERNQTFNFDHIFPEDSDQEKIYLDAVKPLVDCIKMGYNGTVFAYGQTGTGKTYTMGSGSQKSRNDYEEGIIPRALKQLFDYNNQEEIQVYITFCEIYNEKVFDLLGPKKTPLAVSGFTVPDLTKKYVINVQEANDLLEWGNKNRHTGKTKQNSNSSRSHAIFTVDYKNILQNTTAKLNLVDLAGSESAKKNGTTGSTFQEGININKGLLTLGQVIKALSIKSPYIPYRDSMITTILHDSLNGDNYISLISCISANPEDVLETMQTLDFAQKVKKIKNNPIVNSIVDKFKKENGFARTPLKRATILKPSTAKKMALPLISVIDESDQVSVMSSTTSTLTEDVLSPLMRKYFSKLEENVVYRLTTALKNTVQAPTSSTPIQDKLMAQRLEYSPDQTFKIPLCPAQNTAPRRSMRLSMKIDKENDVSGSFIARPRKNSPIISMSPAPRRPLKKINDIENDSTNWSISAPRRSLRLSSVRRRYSEIPSVKNEPHTNRKCCNTQSPKIRKTASKILVECALKSNIRNNQDSPHTNHSKKVLNILNIGTKQDIEKLHFVGSKTAEQVLLYRKLKGRFNTLEDLRPTLGTKRYQTFIRKNFLTKD